MITSLGEDGADPFAGRLHARPCFVIWAASWQNQPAKTELSLKKAWVLSYPLSAQRRHWSDWADAQADLSLRWAHSHFVGFVTRQLNFHVFPFFLLVKEGCDHWLCHSLEIRAAAWQNQQNDMCAQRRLISALASTQPDRSLRSPLEKVLKSVWQRLWSD